MLAVVTGLPGHGKTLWTLSEIRKLEKKSGRRVFYWNIPELKFAWEKLENPDEWYELPEGSIIVLDEAQKIFPGRSHTAKVPRKCSEFETHRHKGFDIFLITQDAKLLDHHVRRLAGRHVHIRRPFGTKFANVLEWEAVKDPNDRFDVNAALKSKFIYPKELFGFYHSADMHTYKSSLPWKKLLLLPGLVLILVFLAIWLNSTLFKDDKPESPLLTSSVPGVTQLAPTAQPRVEKWSPEYLAARIPGLEYTAPMYDKVTTVRTFPKISGCMLIEIEGSSDICRCNSQQGTRLHVTNQQCRSFVRNRGWFDFSKDEEESGSGASDSRNASRANPSKHDPADPSRYLEPGTAYFVTEKRSTSP